MSNQEIVTGLEKQGETAISGDNRFVVTCVDKRYSKRDLQARYHLPEGYGGQVAGVAKAIVNSATARAYLYEQLRTLQSVGVVFHEVVLVDHFGDHGCKAYGAECNQANHEKHLRLAAAIIHREHDFENVKVTLLLHDIDQETVIEVPLVQPALAQASERV